MKYAISVPPSGQLADPSLLVEAALAAEEQGLGLGADSGGELTRFGQITEPKPRGDRLDEGVNLLVAMWSGAPVAHPCPAFPADGITVRPRPVQRSRVPLWFAARGGSAMRPVRRAAHFDGLVPIEVNGDQLSRMFEVVVNERGSLEGFDTMVSAAIPPDEAGRRGTTWSYRSISTHASPGDLFDLIGRDPAGL